MWLWSVFVALALASDASELKDQFLQATQTFTEGSPPPPDVVRPFHDRLVALEKRDGRTYDSAVLAGMIHLGLGERKASLSAFEWALEKDPSDAQLWWTVAQALEGTDPALGVTLFEKAVRALPEDGELKMGLADRLAVTERRYELYVQGAQQAPSRSTAYCLERAIQTTHALGRHDRADPLVSELRTHLAGRPFFDREKELTPGRRFVVREHIAGDPVWVVTLDRKDASGFALYQNGVVGGEPVEQAQGHWLFSDGTRVLKGPPDGATYDALMKWAFSVASYPRGPL